MTSPIATQQSILVAGGGIGGMIAALGAAESGHEVVTVERNASLGGGTALLCRPFSRMCPPDLWPGDQQGGLDGYLIQPTKLIDIAQKT